MISCKQNIKTLQIWTKFGISSNLSGFKIIISAKIFWHLISILIIIIPSYLYGKKISMSIIYNQESNIKNYLSYYVKPLLYKSLS